MTNTITFKWSTGKIELAADAVLAMPAAQLSIFIKTATVNREEVKAEIAAFIAAELKNYDPKVYSHKPIIERYNKLLAVCEGKKQNRRDKAIMRIVNNVLLLRFLRTRKPHKTWRPCLLPSLSIPRFCEPVKAIMRESIIRAIPIPQAAGNRLYLLSAKFCTSRAIKIRRNKGRVYIDT